MDTAQALSAGQWFGTHIRRSNYGGNFGSEILKIDTENFKFDKNFKLWVDEYSHVNPRFYNDNNNPDNFVSYPGQDLIDFISKGGIK
jgi:hypothetical protein